LLGGYLNELRAELGVENTFQASRFNMPPFGGDPNIIDGPHDYAYNKLTNQQKKGPVSTSTSPYTNYNQPGVPPYNHMYMQPYSHNPGPSRPYPPHEDPYIPPHQYPPYYPPQAYPYDYPNYPRESHSAGNFDNRSWSSNSTNSFKMGRSAGPPCHPQNYCPPYCPPYPSNNFLHPQHPHMPFSSTPSPEKWNHSHEEDLTTSSGSDKKKLAAQLKIKNMIEQKSSRVVHVKGLESEEINNEIISSLFSNFGNISRLLFLKKKHTALVEYIDQDSASVAKEMLNNLTFFGSQLKVSYSNYASIDENIASSNNPEKFKDIYVPNSKTFRFKEYKKISINPPSKVLHLSNIAKEIYNERDITELFSKYATVKKVKLIKASEEEKCMALVELSTLESALVCISTIHNKLFFSR
jgi:RNA recognition motif-containing protein